MYVVTYETPSYIIFFPALRVFLLFITAVYCYFLSNYDDQRTRVFRTYLPLVIPDVVLLFVASAICNNYCLHKGECTQPESCTCPPGYSGKRCEICKCARKEEEVRTGHVHSIPDSFRAGIKIILERVSVHTQKRCGGAISVTERSCAAPILNVERYISNGFCAILWCSVNTYSSGRGCE